MGYDLAKALRAFDKCNDAIPDFPLEVGGEAAVESFLLVGFHNRQVDFIALFITTISERRQKTYLY